MAEQIFLSDSRTAVDRKYVGFTPNGGSIKPVHVAGGVLRSIYGKYNTTMSIKRLALVSDAKGVVPKGNELDTIYDSMKEREKIEESVTPNALESLRNVMQRLLSADKGVYVVKGLKDDMISYTAGSTVFMHGVTLGGWRRTALIKGDCSNVVFRPIRRIRRFPAPARTSWKRFGLWQRNTLRTLPPRTMRV